MVVNAAEDLRKTPMAYEFLEEMHVFVLANVICRPIIILGESTVRSPLAGDSIEQNNFVGIYLPLLWRPAMCERNPVVLCFLHNHFQPLISRYQLTSEPKDMLAIPLVTSRLEPLHIHFLLPHEEPKAHDLLQQYLYTSEVPRRSEDDSSDEVILVAEILYSKLYYSWEELDYMILTENSSSPMDAQKIAQLPSKSSTNYIQPAKGNSPVHQTLQDLQKANQHAKGCPRCRGMLQKMGQLSSSVGIPESSLGNRDSSKIQFDRSKGYPDQSCPDLSKSHGDYAKIHHDHSAGHLDSADWTGHLQSKQSKTLAGVGQDHRHVSPEAESIPDSVTIFNTLKKLKSPHQDEGATCRVGHLMEKGRQHGAGGGGYGWGNAQSPASGSMTRTGEKPILTPLLPNDRRTKEERSRPLI